MSRRYSPEEREYAVQRVVANRGDIARTAKELGISTTTLYRWCESGKKPASTFSTFSTNSTQPASNVPNSPDSNNANSLPPDDLQALRDLKAQMLELARYIMVDDRIKQAIDAAPLNQRIAAATQLIDRIIKLGTQLPVDEEEVEIINYEPGETDEEDSTAGESAWETADYSE